MKPGHNKTMGETKLGEEPRLVLHFRENVEGKREFLYQRIQRN